MHRRLGSATLSQLAFPGESNPNFPLEKSHWDYTNVLVKVKEVFQGNFVAFSMEKIVYCLTAGKKLNLNLRSVMKFEFSFLSHQNLVGNRGYLKLNVRKTG